MTHRVRIRHLRHRKVRRWDNSQRLDDWFRELLATFAATRAAAFAALFTRNVESVERGVGIVIVPRFDYLVVLGSSTTDQTYGNNPALGRQEQASRKTFADAGYDLPIINKAVSGYTIANLDTNVNTLLTALGPISAADPSRVAVVINIGSNDIGVTDYDDMLLATRNTMSADLNSVLDKVVAFGFTPILATSNSRKTFEALYEEWAVKFYRPIINTRMLYWYADPLAVIDYAKLYTDNKDVANWWQSDNVHPNAASEGIRAHTIQKLGAKATLPAIGAAERVIFHFPATTTFVGGMNSINAAASGTSTTVVNRNGSVISGASFGWSGASSASTSTRANPGAFNVDLAHVDVQAGKMVATGVVTFTANFGAAYASRTGTLRVTGCTSLTDRNTLVTVGANSATINTSNTGVQIVELPFTLDGAGALTFTAERVSPSTHADVNGVEFVFA